MKTLLLVILSLLVASHLEGWIPHAVLASPSPVAKIAVSPHSRAGLNYTVGTTASFAMNLTGGPSINGFFVTLSYNYSVLHVTNLDLNNNVLGPSAQTWVECVQELNIHIGNCGVSGAAVQVFLLLLGSTTTAPTNGLLFQLTFQVVDIGFSELHFFNTYLTNGTQTPVPLETLDGYFTNKECGPSLCKPPVPGFSISPSRLAPDNTTQVAVGRQVTFDGSKSNATNQRANVTQWTWDFGDNTAADLNDPNPTTTHAYDVRQAKNIVTVTLSVRDSYGISGSKSMLVQIIFVWTDLVASGLSPDPIHGILPGTPINVTGQVTNLSVDPENATLELFLGNSSAQRKYIPNMPPNTKSQISLLLDTSGWAPRVYQIRLVVDPVVNMTTRRVIENDTNNNVLTAFVQVVSPIPSGYGVLLGLNLSQTSLLAIAMVAILGTAGSLVGRWRRKPLEALS